MRKELILIMAILLSITTYAVCDISDTLDEKETKLYTADGTDYNISFDSIKNESGDMSVKFTVNKVATTYLETTMKYVFSDLSEITINTITLGVGNANDTAQFCFNSGLSCIGCGSCTTNLDCKDNNTCTIDECDGDPLFCHHKLILWCRDDDGCCPESRCTEENDNDCGKPVQVECINNSECDDNTSATIDVCNNKTHRCENTMTLKCIEGDDYCPKNCTMDTDADCDECTEHEDCSDDNACTSDSCSGSPKRCGHNTTQGCDLEGKCISIGTRTEESFCNKDSIMESLRAKKEFCDFDYECLNNICKKNKCKGIGFFGWIKGLFGK